MRVPLLATSAFFLMVTGCRSAEAPGTLFYASGADLQSINPLLTTHPLAKQVQRYVLLMTLVQYDSALAMKPYLAESWEWNRERTVLTMRLRSDVKWHDGRPTTADDVVHTLMSAKDQATGYPRAAELACVENVRGGESVTISFCRPQTGVPDVFTDLAIVPRHVPRETFNLQPVGNGPYRFVEHEPNRRWVFEANPDFPSALGGRPAIDRFVVVVVDEATTKLAGIVDGELDLAGINPLHASIVRRVPERAVLDYPLLFTYGLIWNTSREPFTDPRVRRALTMALNRRQMLDAYVYGFGEIADGPVPSSHPLATPVPSVPFDRSAARAILDSTGRHKAGPYRITLLTVGSSDNVLEQLIQADLAAVGVEVTIRQLELGAFLAAAQGSARDYDALVTGIPGDLALGYLGALFDSRRLAGPMQYARYRNPDVDAALDRRDYAEVQRIIARDLPITFLYHARGVQGVNRRVRGLKMDIRGELASLASWSLENPRTAHPAPRTP